MVQDRQAQRFFDKSTLHSIQSELQTGYSLSPIEAKVLARRLQQLVDEQTGFARQQGQVTYQAIAVEEPAGKPLAACRKIPVHLTVTAEEDAQVWAREGPEALRRIRVHRLVYESLLQGGALSQEDLACLLAVSRKTIQRIFTFYREQGETLPSRGEIQDMGRGASHKVPAIRRYVQDLSFSRISHQLGRHGIPTMARYLRHFSLVMILEDQGLTPGQMQSVIGVSENLVEQYRQLYAELDVPQHTRTLERLKRTIVRVPAEVERGQELAPPAWAEPGKRGER
jgi:hypothetical protein